MRVLGIDTSSADGSVALVERLDGGGPQLVAEMRARVSNAHGESLLPLVDAVLRAANVSLADVDRIAVGVGPGSFTGTRIGVATAKGLALGASRPLTGVDAFTALAAERGPSDLPVVVAIDARKGEVYVAVVEQGVVHDPAHVPPGVAFAHVEARLGGRPFAVAGDGVELVAALAGRRTAPEFRDAPRAATVARLALGATTDEVATLEPLYVRPPDITLPAGGLPVIQISGAIPRT